MLKAKDVSFSISSNERIGDLERLDGLLEIDDQFLVVNLREMKVIKKTKVYTKIADWKCVNQIHTQEFNREISPFNRWLTKDNLTNLEIRTMSDLETHNRTHLSENKQNKKTMTYACSSNLDELIDPSNISSSS